MVRLRDLNMRRRDREDLMRRLDELASRSSVLGRAAAVARPAAVSDPLAHPPLVKPELAASPSTDDEGGES